MRAKLHAPSITSNKNKRDKVKTKAHHFVFFPSSSVCVSLSLCNRSYSIDDRSAFERQLDDLRMRDNDARARRAHCEILCESLRIIAAIRKVVLRIKSFNTSRNDCPMERTLWSLVNISLRIIVCQSVEQRANIRVFASGTGQRTSESDASGAQLPK